MGNITTIKGKEMIINLIKYLTKKTQCANIASDGLRNPKISGDHDTVILNDNSNMTGCYTLYNTPQGGRCIGSTDFGFLTSRHHLCLRKLKSGTNMENKIIPFSFADKTIRTLMINDKPYAVGADVATVLGYVRPSEAVKKHCKGTLKWRILTEGGEQLMLVIPEGDIFRLITHSKLPLAVKFEQELYDVILPTLYKTGSYTLATQSSNPILDYDKVYTYELNNVFLPHTLHFRFDDRTTFAYLLDRDMFDCLGNGNYEGKGSFLPYFFKYSPDKAYDNFFDFADVLEIAHRKNTLKTNIFLYESRNILKWLQKLTGKKITPISRYVGTTLQRITA